MIRISQRDLEETIKMMDPTSIAAHDNYGIQVISKNKQEIFDYTWGILKNTDWHPYYQGGQNSDTWFYIEFMRPLSVEDIAHLNTIVLEIASKFDLELI
jgi:hypothetical protein